MKKTILSVLLGTSFLLVGASSISAQTPVAQTSGVTQSVSGDEVCGGKSADKNNPAANECAPQDFKEIAKRLLLIFTLLGGSVLLVVALVRLSMSWYAYRSGDAGAIKRAGEQAFNALIGFILIFAIGGGLYLALLKYLGTQEWAVQLFKMVSDAFVSHAYAAGTAGPSTNELLPNAFSSTSAYDILLSGASLIVRFFVYPAIIVMWVWSGFQFVYARGNPEGLSKAKSWLFWAVIITVVALMLQGFLLAFKNTANKVLGSTSSQSSVTGAQNVSGLTGSTARPVSAADAAKASGVKAPGVTTPNGGSCTLDASFHDTCSENSTCVNNTCQPEGANGASCTFDARNDSCNPDSTCDEATRKCVPDSTSASSDTSPSSVDESPTDSTEPDSSTEETSPDSTTDPDAQPDSQDAGVVLD